MAYVDEYPDEAKVVRACFAVAFAALGIGALFGIIQALHRTGWLRIISNVDYYTVLTAHGVLLALVFTIYFLVGLFTWGVTSSLDRNLRSSSRFTWGWFGLMTLGVVMAATAILGGLVKQIPMSADVLYTFYAPLEAHPVFYIGLAVFVVGSWLAGLDWFRTWWDWKKDNRGERTPLRTFMVLTTMLMWYLSSAGVAAEVV
ncbi:MAG: cbb3-type cytochrome c oxidase subunit I, partial [Halobacteria archaeon]|nr:cbb3-type cytochrome c oxidase subunit I [Halobacteria archaeon]